MKHTHDAIVHTHEHAGGSLAPRSVGDRRYRPARPMQPARGPGPDVSVRAGGRARAWDENADPFTNAVWVVVMTLRRKLSQPPVIETVPGVGYLWGAKLCRALDLQR
jgi:hypothetical protein